MTLPRFTFTARPVSSGWKLVDGRGVTVGFVTTQTKDDLTRFFVSGSGGPGSVTHSVGFTRTGY